MLPSYIAYFQAYALVILKTLNQGTCSIVKMFALLSLCGTKHHIEKASRKLSDRA